MHSRIRAGEEDVDRAPAVHDDVVASISVQVANCETYGGVSVLQREGERILEAPGLVSVANFDVTARFAVRRRHEICRPVSVEVAGGEVWVRPGECVTT